MHEVKNLGYITDLTVEQHENLGTLREQVPAAMEGFTVLMQGVEKTGALDQKMKELIALALSVKSQSTWCIAIHAKKCLALGATREEMIEASMVAVLMGGGPALMYVKLVQDAIKEFS
ncbi:MAG: carboxymuconolactone decarboxylase family protein [Methanomicrobiaceae archaeon]|nr:carboxymuconolactone decarboxylase family protein [Methanomicrobiaceae archaeon]